MKKQYSLVICFDLVEVDLDVDLADVGVDVDLVDVDLDVEPC